MEVEGCNTSRKELSKLIPELKTKIKLSPEDTARLYELQQKVDKCRSDMQSCQQLATKLEAEVAKLQQAILDAGGSKLKNQQAACERALKELNDAEKALNNAKVTVTSSQKAATKAKKQKDVAEEQLRECEQLLREKTIEFKALEEKAVGVLQAYEDVKAIETTKCKELERATKECENLKKSHAEAQCIEIDLLGQVEAFDRQISESEKKKKHWESKVVELVSSEEEDDNYDFSDDEEEEDAVVEDEMGQDEELQQQQENSKAKKHVQSPSRSSLPKLLFSALEKYNINDIKGDIDLLESERNTLAKNANMGAIEEYRKKEADYLARYDFDYTFLYSSMICFVVGHFNLRFLLECRVADLDEVTEERNAARQVHEDLRRQRLEMFMDGFGRITLKLKEMYQMITLGGDAELELVDSLDPFSEGIVFSVRPPKKSWKNISNLSGGEKTLSSLALVFALHHYKPTPLYVMDEIDAALDFKNVSIVANYIKERTKNAQFIIISLRNNMFELADRLVGIYKTRNATKSVTINPRSFGIANQQNGARTPGHPFGEKTNDTRVRSPMGDVRRSVSFAGADDPMNSENTGGLTA